MGKRCPAAREIGNRPPGSRPLRFLLLEQPSGYKQIPFCFINFSNKVLIIWGQWSAQIA